MIPLVAWVYVQDGRRASEALERGAMARALAAQVYDEQAAAFSARDINAITTVLEGPRGSRLKAGLDECSKVGALPRFFGPKSQVAEMNVTIGQLATLLKEPRGNWLSSTAEVNGLRTALEGRILSLGQALGANDGQVAIQTGGARGATVIQAAVKAELDAQEREDRERREQMAQAEREQAERAKEAQETARRDAEEWARLEALGRARRTAATAEYEARVQRSLAEPTQPAERLGGGPTSQPPPGYIGFTRVTPTPTVK